MLVPISLDLTIGHQRVKDVFLWPVPHTWSTPFPRPRHPPLTPSAFAEHYIYENVLSPAFLPEIVQSIRTQTGRTLSSVLVPFFGIREEVLRATPSILEATAPPPPTAQPRKRGRPRKRIVKTPASPLTIPMGSSVPLPRRNPPPCNVILRLNLSNAVCVSGGRRNLSTPLDLRSYSDRFVFDLFSADRPGIVGLFCRELIRDLDLPWNFAPLLEIEIWKELLRWMESISKKGLKHVRSGSHPAPASIADEPVVERVRSGEFGLGMVRTFGFVAPEAKRRGMGKGSIREWRPKVQALDEERSSKMTARERREARARKRSGIQTIGNQMDLL